MLKGISPLISPELLATLDRMGHGDEIVLANAHFPAKSLNHRVLRADGTGIVAMLDAILPLLELDAEVPDPVVMMEPTADYSSSALGQSCFEVIRKHAPRVPDIDLLDRLAFYERARHAFAVVMTGQASNSGNILLRKGVTPPI